MRYLHGVRGMSWLRVRNWQHNNFGFRLRANYRQNNRAGAFLAAFIPALVVFTFP
jgi:hypothetical protein